MEVGDLIGYIGLIFIGVSAGFSLRVLYFWAIQHGYVGLAVVSFMVGFALLTVGSLIQGEIQTYEKRPKVINRK